MMIALHGNSVAGPLCGGGNPPYPTRVSFSTGISRDASRERDPARGRAWSYYQTI